MIVRKIQTELKKKHKYLMKILWNNLQKKVKFQESLMSEQEHNWYMVANAS